MDHEAIKSSLDGLERKILVLLNERKTLREEVKSIATENERLKADLQEKDDKIAEYKEAAQISKLARHIGAREENHSELKKKVDAYIVEINRCIAHLNS